MPRSASVSRQRSASVQLDPLPLGIRTAEDQGRQRRLRSLCQQWSATWRRPIGKAARALHIVADHRVPQRLPIHAAEPRGIGPAHAIKHVADRIQPRRRTPSRVTSRQRPQFRRAEPQKTRMSQRPARRYQSTAAVRSRQE